MFLVTENDLRYRPRYHEKVVGKRWIKTERETSECFLSESAAELFCGRGAATEQTLKPLAELRGVYVQRSLLRRGAEGGTRTHTVSLPTDFESVTSANSITSAQH